MFCAYKKTVMSVNRGGRGDGQLTVCYVITNITYYNYNLFSIKVTSKILNKLCDKSAGNMYLCELSLTMSSILLTMWSISLTTWSISLTTFHSFGPLVTIVESRYHLGDFYPQVVDKSLIM